MEQPLSEDLPSIPYSITFTPPTTPGGQPTWDLPTIQDVSPGTSVILAFSLFLADGSSGSVTYAPEPGGPPYSANAALQWASAVPPAWAINAYLTGQQELDIVDHNLGPAPKGDWGFYVTVTYTDVNDNSTNYQSPDPTIINIEPTGNVREGRRVSAPAQSAVA